MPSGSKSTCRARSSQATVAGLGDRLGAGGQPVVGVLVVVPEPLQRVVAVELEDLAPVVAEVLEQVARVIGQPAPVGEEIRGGHVRVHPRVGEQEVRQHLLDGIVPADRAELLRERGSDHGGADRLGHRRELEHRVGIDGLGLALLAGADTLQVTDLPLVDDRDGDTGHAGLLPVPVDDGGQRGETPLDARRRRSPPPRPTPAPPHRRRPRDRSPRPGRDHRCTRTVRPTRRRHRRDRHPSAASGGPPPTTPSRRATRS